MNVLVHGATGRMGTIVCDLLAAADSDLHLCARVSPGCPAGAADCYQALTQYSGTADCAVDFSHHTAAAGLLEYCITRKLPVVIATTGHTPEELSLIRSAAAEIPVFFSANMSVGVALLAELAQKAAAVFPQADIEIVEYHHNQKLDVPSGTALLLAKRICQVRPDAELIVGRHENGRRSPRDIGIHSIRLGNEVGTHEIILSTGSETVTIKHQAENRRLFAEGALSAVRFLVGKPAGLYDMQDMLSK